MPAWYGIVSTARYAGMSAPDFLALPIAWQERYELSQLAEIEAKHATVEVE